MQLLGSNQEGGSEIPEEPKLLGEREKKGPVSKKIQGRLKQKDQFATWDLRMLRGEQNSLAILHHRLADGTADGLADGLIFPTNFRLFYIWL